MRRDPLPGGRGWDDYVELSSDLPDVVRFFLTMESNHKDGFVAQVEGRTFIRRDVYEEWENENV